MKQKFGEHRLRGLVTQRDNMLRKLGRHATNEELRRLHDLTKSIAAMAHAESAALRAKLALLPHGSPEYNRVWERFLDMQHLEEG